MEICELILLMNVYDIKYDVEQHDDDIYQINTYDIKGTEDKMFINLYDDSIEIIDIYDNKYKTTDLINNLK